MNANSYGTPGTTGGNREDLRGPLTILEPEDTPFTSSVSKGEAPKSTLVEKGADRLRSVKTTGTREGSSGQGGGNKTTKRARFGSYLHRYYDAFGVTDVQAAIAKNGGNAFVSDEYAFDKAKCIREMKRDMEAVNLSNNDGQGGTDDEMKSRGFFKWLAATQTPAVPANFLCPSAQRISGQGNLLESGASSLNAVLKNLLTVVGGRKTYDAHLGVDYQEDADRFTRVNESTTNARFQVMDYAEKHEITMMVKVFESSFGRVNFIPNVFVNVDSSGVGNTKALALARTELWELLFLEELHAVDDRQDAAGESGYCKAIGGLFCAEPRGNGMIYNSLN